MWKWISPTTDTAHQKRCWKTSVAQNNRKRNTNAENTFNTHPSCKEISTRLGHLLAELIFKTESFYIQVLHLGLMKSERQNRIHGELMHFLGLTPARHQAFMSWYVLLHAFTTLPVVMCSLFSIYFLCRTLFSADGQYFWRQPPPKIKNKLQRCP